MSVAKRPSNASDSWVAGVELARQCEWMKNLFVAARTKLSTRIENGDTEQARLLIHKHGLEARNENADWLVQRRWKLVARPKWSSSGSVPELSNRRRSTFFGSSMRSLSRLESRHNSVQLVATGTVYLNGYVWLPRITRFASASSSSRRW